MNATLHHPHTTGPNLNRFIWISLVTHFVVLIGLSLTLSHSIRVSPPQAIQVKLIGVPQPTASTKPDVVPEEIRTQDSAAPKEPPKEMKNIPDSKATTKFLDKIDELIKAEPNPIESQKRPPVLDKNPNKKKVVKNDLDAKVVKNPEDFLKALEFVDKLENKNNPTPAQAPATEQDAGQGPELQLNLADSGTVNAIRSHIEKNWLVPPGLDLRGLTVTVLVSLDSNGGITNLRVSQSSGQTFFDESLKRAIYKSIPLPIPADKFEKFRELELTFSPPQ